MKCYIKGNSHGILDFREPKPWMKEEWLTEVDDYDLQRYQFLLKELDEISEKYRMKKT
jgi:hypothetical protein